MVAVQSYGTEKAFLVMRSGSRDYDTDAVNLANPPPSCIMESISDKVIGHLPSNTVSLNINN